jgi:putative transposase
METVRIYSLPTLPSSLRQRLYQAQQEAARVWAVCRDRHQAARQQRTRWPDCEDLHLATKGRFALHSQTVQMICHQFLANVEATRELRKTNGKIHYPHNDKRFFPLYWPAQAVSVERGQTAQADQVDRHPDTGHSEDSVPFGRVLSRSA